MAETRRRGSALLVDVPFRRSAFRIDMSLPHGDEKPDRIVAEMSGLSALQAGPTNPTRVDFRINRVVSQVRLISGIAPGRVRHCEDGIAGWKAKRHPARP